MEYVITLKKHGKKISLHLLHGDITDQSTDAIVNAANENLILGAGVAGAIRRKGGPKIQEECHILLPTEVGQAVITTGGNLPAKYVIHAVGPIFQRYKPTRAQKLLNNAIKNSLRILTEHQLTSITFPAISTGIYGFPKELAARTMFQAIEEALNEIPFSLEVQICLFSPGDFEIFHKIAIQQFGSQ